MDLHGRAQSMAERLAKAAGRTDPYQKALTAYGLEGYLAILYGWALLAAVSLLIGALKEAAIVAAAAAALKMFSGGAHLGTPTRCAILGAVFCAGLGLLAKEFGPSLDYRLRWSLLGMSNLLVWLYAPIAVPEKPLQPRQRRILRWLARALAGLLTLVCLIWKEDTWPAAVLAGIAFQSLILSRVARRLLAGLDRRIVRLTRIRHQAANYHERRCRE